MSNRLIEEWLPIADIGIESLRERTPMTPFPAPNRLHVWWARRPLVSARAAILASILPAGADRDKFKHMLGIHGDPVEARKRITIADRKGERLGANAYGYPRAFSYTPTDDEKLWAFNIPNSIVVLDPTAGGGSIPFESARLGLTTIANDINPVSALILSATVKFPHEFSLLLRDEIIRIGQELSSQVKAELAWAFPDEPEPDCRSDGYLWARTIRCPFCEGLVPLSPNWKLAPDGTGVRLIPNLGTGIGDQSRVCSFEIVKSAKDHSAATVSDGDGSCPYPDCGRPIVGDEIKRQAQAGGMGEQLFTVVFQRRIVTKVKSGKRGKDKWERKYRAPRIDDLNIAEIQEYLANKIPEWEAYDYIPNEPFPEQSNDCRPIQYGMPLWRDLFSPRQLLCHVSAVEVYRKILSVEENKGLSKITRAAFIYLALSLDKLLDYNSRMTRWHSNREVMVNTFDRHDFSFKWSYAEMAPLISGNGFDWAIEQTAKCAKELVEMSQHNVSETCQPSLFDRKDVRAPLSAQTTVTNKTANALDDVDDKCVDVIVMDPPYYDNVMYAELSDFFYVWLKRTAGHVMPELFTQYLTDKENEAVANPAKFIDQKGAKALSGRDYQERMKAIFAECRRVLKPDGIMTVMFTHKATGAWDALTMGLIEGGFIIKASWPINTEAEGSLHIKAKSAANSTIFLVCKPRESLADKEIIYWEDVEPKVAQAVRKRIKEFQDGGISGVDLYLACFGPALEEFSKYTSLKRGTPRPVPESRKRRKQAELFEEEWDPYKVNPEDALDAARREVKRWRLEQLTQMKARAELDAITSWFVLAWDAFKAPVFPFDEALRLARAVGVDLDKQIVGRLCEKKGSDLVIFDSGRRAAKGAVGSPDGSQGMIDAVHHAANIARTRSLTAAKELLEKVGLINEPAFMTALKAVLEVLPVSKAFTGIDLEGEIAASGNDFEALEKLRVLAFSGQVSRPKQLDLWQDEATA